MTIWIIVILALNLIAMAYIVKLVRGGSQVDFLQKEIQNLRTSFDTKIGDSTKQINDSVHQQLKESSRIVQDVTKHLTELGETNKQVIGFAEQLQKLQDVLQNPKQRGILGEYYLETVLQNVLPPGSYQMQYSFSDGDIVDAIVRVKDKIIPVDSKFSLENYNRMIDAGKDEKAAFEKTFVNDLKLRIQETAKYIKPEEGTVDFAFMFIPSEGIYYDLITNKVGADDESLIQRAASRDKVIIVSPTSFLAYLQTVLQGLKAMEIEEKAQDILKNVSKLSSHLNRYEDYYTKLGNQLATTVNHYNAGYKELNKIDKDVLKITGESSGVEVLEIEKPEKQV
ncbi:DNA recombination protein RmuC [Candidatus Kaiserbacteria bacterium]|nr:MAG: DNA recombination protein RmuC [Candidatus Kaiserbacteria bacterium]